MVSFETSLEVYLLKVLSFCVLSESIKVLVFLIESVLEFLIFVFLLSLFDKKIL